MKGQNSDWRMLGDLEAVCLKCSWNFDRNQSRGLGTRGYTERGEQDCLGLEVVGNSRICKYVVSPFYF